MGAVVKRRQAHGVWLQRKDEVSYEIKGEEESSEKEFYMKQK